MAGYSDTRKLIIDTLMGRPAGTEIKPEDHQAFVLALNDYIRNVELNSGNAFIGFAQSDTVPIQSNNGQCFYISTVPPGTNIVYANFIDYEGNPISVTTPPNKMAFVTLIWNTRNWDSQITIIETNWSQIFENNIAPNSIDSSKIIDGTIQSTDLNPNAFDNTLTKPDKIAPADVVGSKLTELLSYINGMEGGVNGFAEDTSFQPNYPEDVAATVIGVGPGTFTNMIGENGSAITVDSISVVIFFKAAGSTYWKYKTILPTVVIEGNVELGVKDYAQLQGKPFINGKELASGENTLDELGIQPKGNYTTASQLAATLENYASKAAVDTLQALIPATATADNQLADKDFVNSSIATATAEFKGSFTSLDELKATSGNLNDYAFYLHKDSVGNSIVDRYKWTTAGWLYEYTLNNSSFTAEQWAALNSGITATLVNSYNSHLNNSTIHITSDERTKWNNKWDYNEETIKAVKVNAAISADKATKLATARKIWGRLFDGLADVSGDLEDVGNITASGKATIQGDIVCGGEVVAVAGEGTPAGVTDYSVLTGKPQINGVTLVSGNNTLATLGIQAAGDYATNSGVNTLLADYTTKTFVSNNYAGKSAFNAHIADTNIHITAAERDAWSNKWDYNEETIKAVKVNSASSADSVAWANITNKPSTFTPSAHTHAASEINGLPTNLSSFTNDVGYITGITKSMVEEVLRGNITSHTHTFASLTSKPTTIAGYGITDALTTSNYNSYAPTLTGTGASGTWGISITGNAASATKLQTPRTIWGRNFDGSGNIWSGIDVDGYTSTNSITKVADLGTVGLVINASSVRNNWGMCFWTEGNGRGMIQQQAFDSAAATYPICLQPFGGNILIGTTTDNGYKLQVNGKGYYSDDLIVGGEVVAVAGEGTPAGVTDYSALTGKPQINGVTLVSGNNTLATLGIQAAGDYATNSGVTTLLANYADKTFVANNYASKTAFNSHTADSDIHITAAERAAWDAKWDYNENTIKAVKVNSASSADSVAWSGISGKPTTFTPSAHTHTASEVSGLPTSLKNPYALTFGSKTYDGSAAATITASDLGALTAHQSIYALTLQVNGTSKGVYNPASAAKTINIAVPTKTSDITNDSGFITSAAIPTALKNPYAVEIKANGVSLGTYDGSAAATFNLSAANVGAANKVHTHTASEISGLPTNLSAFTNDVGFVTVRQKNGYSYNNLNSLYVSDALIYRIDLTDVHVNIWTMLFIEVSLRQHYTHGYAGKILINLYHGRASDFTAFNATILGNLNNINVYGSDGRYIYIYASMSYSTISVDRVLVGDDAIKYDLSNITIEKVDSLPDTYQTATIYNSLHTGNFTKSLVEGVLTGDITSHTHSYLPLAGGTIDGTLNIYNTVYRSTIKNVSQTNQPCDLWFGANGTEHWSLTSRASAENYLLALYASYNDGGVDTYVFTANLQTGVVDFKYQPTVNGNAIIHSGNIGSYNAGSATKLQTARTIFGQSFDGTAKVSGTVSDIRRVIIGTDLGDWDSNRAELELITTSNNANDFWLGTNSQRDWCLSGRTSADGNALHLYNKTLDRVATINQNGNILIGTTTDNGYKLDVNGKGHYSGDLIVDGEVSALVA